jgi:hypothetical protein
MPEQIEVTYRAKGGRPPVDLDLHLGADGQASLFAGSSFSNPRANVSRVGTFGGPAPVADVAALVAYVAEHDLLARGGRFGRATPDMPLRFVELIVDGHQAQFHLTEMTADIAIDGFERLLQDLALTLTGQPTRAAEASLDLSEIDGRIAATIELRSIGSRPLTVLLVDPDVPGMTLRARVELAETMVLPSGATMPIALGNAVLPLETVQELAQAGDLPRGIVDLPPGARYRFALPPLDAPRTDAPVNATGTLQFWFPEGQARRAATLVTPETPLR